jgi:hypothetical protein
VVLASIATAYGLSRLLAPEELGALWTKSLCPSTRSAIVSPCIAMEGVTTAAATIRMHRAVAFQNRELRVTKYA